MVSKQVIPIIGLNVTVYGLDEYKQLPKGTPITVLFALHGRLQNQSKMEPVSQAICRLNSQYQKGNRYIMVVTFDAPNHGSRLVNKLSNHSWMEGQHRNPNHALDMWTSVVSMSKTVSELIDVLEFYLFPDSEESSVEVWGVLGFSMGGHATFIAAAEDPRITVAIPIVGTADYMGLMEQRLDQIIKYLPHPKERYLPRRFHNMVCDRTYNLDERLKSKHIFIMNAERDQLVPGKFNWSIVKSLRKNHIMKEGYGWGYYLVPNVGHEWCQDMINAASEWCFHWMVKGSRDYDKESKI